MSLNNTKKIQKSSLNFTILLEMDLCKIQYKIDSVKKLKLKDNILRNMSQKYFNTKLPKAYQGDGFQY